jgi:protein adenylyltransferase
LIEELRVLLADPFTEQPGMARYAGYPPDWAGSISVSCSS